MKPVDQSLLHLPDKGLFGDCQRAVIASLLELPITAVPHFLEDNTSDSDLFSSRIDRFLSPLGLMHLVVGRFDFQSWRSPVYHAIYGPTDRDTWHAVVGCNGVIVHDPHPSRAGLDVTRQGDWTYGFIISNCTGDSTHERY